jgi:hypothetical protein
MEFTVRNCNLGSRLVHETECIDVFCIQSRHEFAIEWRGAIAVPRGMSDKLQFVAGMGNAEVAIEEGQMENRICWSQFGRVWERGAESYFLLSIASSCAAPLKPQSDFKP